MTAEHTPEQLALARVTREDAIEWMECAMRNFRHLSISEDDIEDVRLELERFRRAAIVETTERAVRVVEQQQQDFLSPEYATGQPLSSFQERFACGQIADALRTYAHLKDPSHADG